MKTIFSYLLAIALSCGLISCGDLGISDRIESFPIPEIKGISFNNFNNSQSELSETAPPIVIQKLGRIIDNYKPQVSILEPLPDKVLDDTRVTIQLKVADFPLFKDENLEMGPHLHLILDNKPYQAIYSVKEPIVLENLDPGTHILRVFAVRPWHESFKNQGAYAETTFHILTKTQENNPESQVPLLTYSRPNGTYGAEPIMLDFYLSHLPNEQIIRDSSREGLPPWRVKATVNGESFILDQWQPVYLTGFKEGNNWIQLELLDDEGNSINNTFNNTVRLITYDPETKDSLARIVTGEIDLPNAIAIVDPNYEIPLEETLEAVSEKVVEEEATTESDVTKPVVIPADNSEEIEEEVNPEAEIIPETSEVPQEQVVAPEITKPVEVPADKSELIEEEVNPEEETVNPEAEIIPETSEVPSEPVVEPEIPQPVEIPVDNSEVIEEQINPEAEIIPETSEVPPEPVVEPEIPQPVEIPANNSELTEEEVILEAEIISEIPEVIKEEVVEPGITQPVEIAADKSEVIEEKVKTKEEISQVIKEEVSGKNIDPELNIPENNSELSDDKLSTTVDIPETEINLNQETAISGLEVVKAISEVNESTIIPKDGLGNEKEVIEPEEQKSLAEEVTTEVTTSVTVADKKTIETNESASETESDRINDLVSISKNPFEININLDQWVADHFKQFKDKIIELSKLFLD